MASHLVKQHLKRMEDLIHAMQRACDDAIAAWDAEDDAQLDLALERSLAQARIREQSDALRSVGDA